MTPIETTDEAVSSQRTLTRRWRLVVTVVSVAASLFHLWVNTVGVLPESDRNALHFGFLVLLAFLIFPPARKALSNRWLALDGTLALLAVSAALYIPFFEGALHDRNEVTNTVDLVFAALAILLVLEAARRTSGSFIPILSVLFLTYALYWGKLIGGMLAFPGVTLQRLLYRMYFAPDGIFGAIATVSSTFVFLFVLFGAFLLRSGAGEFLLRLALSLLGRTVGGPGKMAVLASGLLGSISGSAIANTVGSGSLTIPMMKRVGFSPTFAGAVEAAASTGGQLMPPIMGAGAFIMSQWTQIPYLTIIAAALLPAIMYFLSVVFFVHIRAYKIGIRPLDPSEIPVFGTVLKEGWNFFIPIAVLIVLLMVGYTPTYAAGVGIVAIVASSWLRKDSRMGVRHILDALELGARNMVTTGVILLCSGIVVGVVLLVGIGIKFSLLITATAGSSLLLTILLVAAASLILGMGLPVTASYIVLAVLTAPALMQLGAGLLAAHLVIFWYSQDANVTPPVCLAAYTAAGIAGSNPLATGMQSWKIAKGLYIIPLLFCYSPLLLEGAWWEAPETAIAGTLGLFALAVAFEGHWRVAVGIVGRAAAAAIGVLLLWPNLLLHLVGALLLSAFAVSQRRS